MKVVFRVDASDSIASGHLTRCLALAESLRGRGAECIFISREVEGHLFSSVIESGFEQRALPGPLEFDPDHVLEDNPPLEAADDANLTIEALAGQRADWLVVDHYAIGEEWERILRPHVDRIFVIDDLADRHHDCDVLLDQNYSRLGAQRYMDLVPKACTILCGPRYAMLQPEFARHRLALARTHSPNMRAFISFGGIDRNDLTGLTIAAFGVPELASVTLDVAIGQLNPNRDRLEQLIAKRPRSRAHIAPKSLASLMAQADFAVGAGGTTTWERCCLDLPSVVVGLADNQVPSCESLAADGWIDYVGFWTDVTAATLSKAILRVVSASHTADITAAEPLVDGFGVQRVAEVIDPSPLETLRLRPATSHDIDSFFWWVNDPEVRIQSLNSAPVHWSEHANWFREHLALKDSMMCVLEARGLPVGQIRFDCSDGIALLDYSLDTIVRGRGLAATLVQGGLQQLAKHQRVTVTAVVRDENLASVITLTQLGFEVVTSSAADGTSSYVHSL